MNQKHAAKPVTPSRTRPRKPPIALARRAVMDEEFPTPASVGFLIREIYRRITRILKTIIAPYKLTLGMWYFLRSLWEEDGVTQRELCKRVSMTEPTAVVALKVMEKRGFIRRVADKNDGRKYYIFLTPEARALKKKVLPRVAKVSAGVFLKGLPRKDADQLLTLLHHVLGNVSEK
jgi:DNA-binding MarR family transcriptional regulator